ncbi:MurR/RpiR family transcriptional regulator [Vagococcus intermedius]|uniref:MurR/RpiR family transcriptional regulator n=1 Tax=Vagococcus intermedius TaxID=2991418 RepID=A0AAF0CVN2_9ENTE|nr:MurR/RpiR family transcriptional regulator [Vagococcus intermedius]WEG73677.1 MurR/RpiR family transcriptional regulator [Vagococcus intermedius]WEG75761.1 MurR/RpiR family transcriptional regulator [Vagococcus intermedius]
MSFFQNKNLINHLSEAESAIYSYIVNNSEKVQYMRVRDLAMETHTSATTVFRFIKKLGYESFPEFKLSFKKECHKWQEDKNSSLLEQHFDILNPKNFNQDLEYLINQMVNQMGEAETIIFCGMGASGSVAKYASRKLANIGYNSFSIDDPTYPIRSRFSKTGHNLLIVISSSGETTELAELVVENTGDSNIYTICITGNRYGKIAKLSDYIIDYEISTERSHRYYDLSSQIPAMFIVELAIDSLRQKSKSGT